MNSLPSIKIGDWQATCLRDTLFWVDAGTMFHMIPKVLWEKKVEPDEKNRVGVALNCLLLQNRKTGENILVDAGIGCNYNRKMAEIYKLNRNITLKSDFYKAGLSEDDIDTVILTHLHLDHTGWLSVEKEGERKRNHSRGYFIPPIYQLPQYFDTIYLKKAINNNS